MRTGPPITLSTRLDTPDRARRALARAVSHFYATVDCNDKAEVERHRLTFQGLQTLLKYFAHEHAVKLAAVPAPQGPDLANSVAALSPEGKATLRIVLQTLTDDTHAANPDRPA